MCIFKLYIVKHYTLLCVSVVLKDWKDKILIFHGRMESILYKVKNLDFCVLQSISMVVLFCCLLIEERLREFPFSTESIHTYAEQLEILQGTGGKFLQIKNFISVLLMLLQETSKSISFFTHLCLIH